MILRLLNQKLRYPVSASSYPIWAFLLLAVAALPVGFWVLGVPIGERWIGTSAGPRLRPADLRNLRHSEAKRSQRLRRATEPRLTKQNANLSADFSLQQKLTQLVGDGEVDDQFAISTAISGDTAVIGAYNADIGTNSDQGVAYVFIRSGGMWSQQQKLRASDGAAGDGFGVSVAIQGDTLIVGAYGADAGSQPAEADRGSAYVFARSGGIWTEQQKLLPANGAGGDIFGFAVAVQADTALIGAPLSDSIRPDGGAVYIFTRNGTSWAEQQELLAIDAAEDDAFGVALALEANTAAIGALRHDVASNNNQGAAYVFTGNGSIWSQEQELVANDGASNDQFGVSIGLSGNSIIVGANFKDNGTNLAQGAAYVFTGSGASWTQQQKLLAPDGATNDLFGTSVAIGLDTAVVGSSDNDVIATDQGSAYTFTRHGATWTHEQNLTASDGSADDFFGSYVAIDGNTLVVGAPVANISLNADQGAAYIFHTTNSTLVIDDAEITEGDTGTTSVKFTVSLSPANAQTVTVNYATTDGTATAGDDYLAAGGTVTFLPGQTSQTVSVTVNGDRTFEPGETFFVNLSMATNATIDDSQGVGTIHNDDTQPAISINDISLAEGNVGTTTATFTVMLTNASSQIITVNFTTADSTAADTSDYLAAVGMITFAPGQTTQEIIVTINGDTTFEANETFLLNLSSATNAIISDNQAQGTIVNDDAWLPAFEFTHANLNQNESNQSVTLTVRRTGNPAPAATVDFKTNSDLTFVECSVVNAKANQRCDYLLTSGTLSFASNELEKSFDVVIFNDDFVEGNETFSLSLNNPLGGGSVLGALSTATVTIIDDDVSPPSANPIDFSRYFVRQNYYDFLQRVPDQTGEDYWTDQIDQGCGADQSCINRRRVGVSAAFFVSSEFTRSGGYVYRLYKAAFGEQRLYRPLYEQFSPDRARIVDGSSLEPGKLDLAKLFVERDEFTTRYPITLTESQFVDSILQTVQQGAGVSFDATERQGFINDVASGGRGLMLKNLADNVTYTQAVFNRAFVLMQYFGYLRRDPDQEGYEFWLGILNASPQNFEGMVCAFITSPEYQKRFSLVATRTNANCQ